jgi:NAD(P)-dependent dehydrogenase (short-subunit alcohol dehydrogenase family)
MFDFNEKVVLVTGATSGIGRDTAVAFAAAGALVALVGRRGTEGNEAVATVQKSGGKAVFLQADLTEGEAVIAEIVERTVATFGRLDIAFNNAGVSSNSPITEATEDDWDKTVNLNLKSVWLACKHEFLQFKKQDTGGVIVNTSSFLSHSPVSGSSIYSASKGGLDAMTKALALEGGPAGIRVNAVAPGAIATEMSRSRMDPDSERAKFIRNAVPLKHRFGTGEDIAGAVLWLCSEAAGYVTGQVITVDGGMTVSAL